MVVQTEHPRFGSIGRCAARFGWAGDGVVEYRRAPRRDEDAHYVFSELLGYDATRVEALCVASGQDSAFTEAATR